MAKKSSESKLIATGMCLRHQGGKPIAKAQSKDKEEGEDIVDERGGCQSIGAILADHDGVSEIHRDNAQLPKNYRRTDMEELA